MSHDGFSRHLYEYRHDGAVWGIEIQATSRADADERLRRLAWAKYQGEVAYAFPVPSTLLGRLIGRITTWWMNTSR